MQKILTLSGVAGTWEEAITLCGEKMLEAGCISASFIAECIARELEYPTGIPSAIPIAMPHVKSSHIAEDCLCMLRLDTPVDFYRMDSKDEYISTRLVFTLAITNSDDHQDFLENFMEIIQDDEFLEQCLASPLDSVRPLLDKRLNNGAEQPTQ